jgi:hypothetical protein
MIFTITSVTPITEVLGFPIGDVKRYTAESDDGRTVVHLHVRDGDDPISRLRDYTGSSVKFSSSL